MDRQERLRFCRTCQNRNFDPNKGIICNLTNDVATFEDTCVDYSLNIKLKSLERYKNEVRQTKKINVKKKKVRTKEKLTKDDFHLILSTSLLTTFIIRLIYYADRIDERGKLYSIIFFLVLIAISVSLLLRKKELKQYKIFGDFKFKISFTILFAFLNFLYVALVYHRFHYIMRFTFFIFSSTLVISMLCGILVKPVNFLIRRLFKTHEQTS